MSIIGHGESSGHACAHVDTHLLVLRRMVPSLKPYMEDVAVYLDQTVHWVMSSLASGPGVDGKLSIIPYVTQLLAQMS